MRLFEIVGSSEEEVLKNLRIIFAILYVCNNSPDTPAKQQNEQLFISDLHADKDNLLAWVMKSKRIADVYYSIPEKYRK